MKAKVEVSFCLMLLLLLQIPVGNARPVKAKAQGQDKNKILINGIVRPESHCMTMQELSGPFKIETPERVEEMTLYLIEGNRPVKSKKLTVGLDLQNFDFYQWLLQEKVVAAVEPKGVEQLVPFTRIAIMVNKGSNVKGVSFLVCNGKALFAD